MRSKRFIAVALAAALACNMTGMSVAAQPAAAGFSVLKGLLGGDSSDKEKDTESDAEKNKMRSQVYGEQSGSKTEDQVVLDIGRGNIRINGNEISAFDTEGNPVTKTSSKYVVTGSSQEHSIEIGSGVNANIVLSNVDITRTEPGESPVWIADDSSGDVSFTLEGVNNLKAGEGAAAIQKNCTHNGSSCKCGKLKLTCGNTSPSHVCGADCGTLVATGQGGAAAIGGASGMGSPKIDIGGGTITATGGIGGGNGGTSPKVEITGGVVDANTITAKDSVMNGNAILFTDPSTDVDIKKGILYQDGQGTVAGDVKLTQGMTDHLAQADGALDIPSEEGATLTVDGETDISDVSFTEGSEVKTEKPKTQKATPAGEPAAASAEEEKPASKEKAASTPAPTKEAVPEKEPVIEDEGQEKAKNTLSNNYFRSNVVINVKQGNVELYPNQAIEFGEKLTVTATVNLLGEDSEPGVTYDGNGRINVYLVNSDGSEKIPITEAGASQDEINTGQIVKNLPAVLGKPDISLDKQYQFIVEYAGDPQHPGSKSEESSSFFITKGTLTNSNVQLDRNIIAGKKIPQAIDLLAADIPKPTNKAGTEVKGHWEWKEKDKVENTTLYPHTSDAKTIYEAEFKYDNDKEKEKYKGNDENGNCLLTVTFTIVTPKVDVKANISPEKGKPGHDGKMWYNHESGDIEIQIPGYQIFDFKDFPEIPQTQERWGEAYASEVTGKLEFPVDNLDKLKFNKGTYTVYVKSNTGEIGLVDIDDFNVDREYPQVELKDEFLTGETALFQFNAPDEAGEDNSGVWQYTLRTQKRPNGSGDLEDPYDRDQVASSSVPPNATGRFEIEGLVPNTTYDLYLLVEDNAGNETQYIKRIVDNSGNDLGVAPWSIYTGDGAADNLYHGYAFTTDKPNFKGKITMTILDQNDEVKADGTVGAGDKLKVDVVPQDSSIAQSDISYQWYWRDDNGQETMINTFNSNIYNVSEDDIGKVIVCHAIAKNFSSYIQVATPGKVGLGACPAEYAPTNGREDLENRTFTFTGVVGVPYEYRINGGDWTDVPRSDYTDFVIDVGDNTVLAGNLEVRAKETPNYMASHPPLTNDESFISSGELDITLEGDECYGGTLTAIVNSQAIDSGLFSYQWSCDGKTIVGEEGSSYQVRKEDINKKISVKLSITGYPGVDNTATSGTIKKRPVNVVINVIPKQYDGTTTADVEATLDGLINGDNVTASAKVEFEDKKAGENKSVKLTNKQEGGNDLGCYDVRWPNNSDIKGTIQPRVLEKLTMTAQDKEYDGTTDAVVSFVAEALPGDVIEVSGTGQFADKNAGTNKTVTPKEIVITGADASNYTGVGAPASTTANITQKTIELEGITVADKYYDGTTDAVIAATFKGAVDDVSYTYTAAFDNASVGKDKRVTATISLAGESATNYVLTSGAAVGTGNILKSPAPYEGADVPQGLTGIQGKKLSSVYIGVGFSWKDPNTKMETVGKHTYPAVYNPDPSQYGDRELELEVLVQCAEHTWGEWMVTIEPSKEELGERQRICDICGHTETESIARAPYITNEDTKVGWGDVIQAINNAASGTEIPVTMNGTETLPASVLEALQGREVSIVLQMGNGITWTIRGEDITASSLKDINMALTVYTDNIPSDVLDAYASGKTVIQLHLAYSGEFGFVATLRVPFGDEFAGLDSTLYYYNPMRERLEQMDSNKITADGIGRYDFTHASDYAVVIDKAPDAQGGDTPSGNETPPGATVTPIGGDVTPTGGAAVTGAATTGGAAATGGATNGQTTISTSPRTTSANVSIISSNGAKTGDDTPVNVYLFLLLAGAGGITALGAYRYRRKTRG